jgi:hypothetical protein
MEHDKRDEWNPLAPPPRSRDALVQITRRLDHRRALVVTAAFVFFGGSAAVLLGAPLIFGGHLPVVIAVIPPAIFSSLILLLVAGNNASLAKVRHILQHGLVVHPTSFEWVVFVVAKHQGETDLRRACLPVGVPGDPILLLDIALLDRHHDWNPRQNRRIRVALGGTRGEPLVTIPATVTAAQLAASVAILRPPNGSKKVAIGGALSIPGTGIFPFFL